MKVRWIVLMGTTDRLVRGGLWHGRGWVVEAVAGAGRAVLGRVEAGISGLGTPVSRVTVRCWGNITFLWDLNHL